MRKLAIYFLLIIFIITCSNYSMQMFSLEQGSVHTESYNLNHILSSSTTDICNPYNKYIDSLAPNQSYNHSHIVLLNWIANSKSDIIINPINLLPIGFTFPSRSHLHSLTPANTSQNNSILKSLSSMLTSPLLEITVLLV